MTGPIKIQLNEPVQATATGAAAVKSEPLTLSQAVADFRDSRIGGGHDRDIIALIEQATDFTIQEASNLAHGVTRGPVIGTGNDAIISTIASSNAFANHLQQVSDLTSAEKQTIKATLKVLGADSSISSLRTIADDVLKTAEIENIGGASIDASNIPELFSRSIDPLVQRFGNYLENQGIVDFTRLSKIANTDIPRPYNYADIFSRKVAV
ncbi:MAG: hypothetical protein O3C63_05525 [Cyanobacteria bacterium]|nr:hypothetical protein [Cyanobacteriota bacterium]